MAVGERIAQERGLAPWPTCGRFGAPSSDRAVPRPGPSPRTYTVRPGDALSAIAQRTGTPGGARALYSLNRDRLPHGPDRIYPGQTLRVPR
ncbi:LysM peptidoglycan-binding domain-containing protein [Streptomyces sp. RS10V-4]|nr:LysM peptidoglycan-binding domain-containing protein [Streptomyces rhizoryzae]